MTADATMTTGVPGTTSPRPRTVPEEVIGENAGHARSRKGRNASRPHVTAEAGARHFERPGVIPDRQDVIAETDAPEPERRKPSEVITEVAPEVFPSETEPERREPSEVITEIAPEVHPSETEPKPYEPSEVITEIAPEISPSEVAPEIRPDPEETGDDR